MVDRDAGLELRQPEVLQFLHIIGFALDRFEVIALEHDIDHFPAQLTHQVAIFAIA